jgi:hypothetical protein
MRNKISWLARVAVLLTVLAVTMGTAFAADNTGTNPVNFTYDARFYIEMADLADPSGSVITNTFEFRVPLGRDIANLGSGSESPFYDMGQKLGLRIRAKYKSLSLDTGAPPFGTSDVSGIGDIDARILWLAHASKTFVLAPGLEVFFPTATNDALGYGNTVIAPVVFAVFFGLFGQASLFAPGYQYLFDVGGDDSSADISRSQIDLYFVWLLAKGRNWLIVDPQIIIDHDTDEVPALVEVEYGYMIAPLAGASVYLRPGVGVGSDKPYSWNFESGLKFVWR